ncbi:hypothetical protein RhiirC2_786710 [Rhizophagus irregularis]|uniref:Uncharacterized protein n=1 Tax=Rhizophagus irregularis TaxID=588596 RepID=A0A2N1MTU0_9GLOM|nr:hypothetical protein RhiirC2_786710 [Rhizophagus irregularis]
MSKQLFERILEINTNEYLENDLTSSIDFNFQRQEKSLPGEESMQNPPSNSNRDNALSNITNLMDNKKLFISQLIENFRRIRQVLRELKV